MSEPKTARAFRVMLGTAFKWVIIIDEQNGEFIVIDEEKKKKMFPDLRADWDLKLTEFLKFAETDPVFKKVSTWDPVFGFIH